MVSAKLHVICGNCGSNEFLSQHLSDDGDGMRVMVCCENCGTLHDLEDALEYKQKHP